VGVPPNIAANIPTMIAPYRPVAPIPDCTPMQGRVVSDHSSDQTSNKISNCWNLLFSISCLCFLFGKYWKYLFIFK
jgi:hypothetical protein